MGMSHYMHLTTDHLYQIILNSPLDITCLSGTAVEHSNKHLKGLLMFSNNHTMTTKRERKPSKRKFEQLGATLVAERNIKTQRVIKKEVQNNLELVCTK